MSTIYKGTIKWFNVKKFFGFIIPSTGGNDIFLHGSGLPDGFKPQDGQSITYEIDVDRQGRSVAVNVQAV